MHAYRTYQARAAAYFKDGVREIAADNFKFLRFASIATLLLLVFLLLLAPAVIHGWKPSVFHLVFLPVMIVFCAIAWMGHRRGMLRHALPMCIAFEIVLYAFMIFLDTAAEPDSPSTFMQLVCIALPALFIMPDFITYGLLTAAEVVYLVCVITLKEPGIAQYDIFEMITGFLFALCVSHLTMNYRLSAHEMRMKYEIMSKRDTLSNLYNKRAFVEKARAYLESVNPHCTCSLAFLDLDDFKALNDTLGHPAGDEVLIDMGHLLSELFRPTDIIGRFGGDEFLVLVEGMADIDLLRHRFDAVRTRLREACEKQLGYEIGCSVGIVYLNNEPADFDELVGQADAQLYTAKREGKSRTRIAHYVPAGVEAVDTNVRQSPNGDEADRTHGSSIM